MGLDYGWGGSRRFAEYLVSALRRKYVNCSEVPQKMGRIGASGHVGSDDGSENGGSAVVASGAVLLRSRADTATTPGKLRLLLLALAVLSLAWGVLATITVNQHAAAAANVVAVSEPLSLDAQQIYQSLSDADATAATAFLSGGLEPIATRQRYLADIGQASTRIEAATALVGASAARTQLPGHLTSTAAASQATGDDLVTLSADLPVYAGEVETARADNRLGLPLGAAYLREASALLRGKLLPAASDMYTRESGLLTVSSAQATGLPLVLVTIVIGLGIGYVLYRASRWLTRHTHRVLNWGLVAAFVAGAISLLWLTAAFAFGRADLLQAQEHGATPVEALARADIAALQAHADESLTLIDNSGDDSYQQDFLAQQKLLGPGPGSLLTVAGTAAAHSPAAGPPMEAATDALAWYRAHVIVRSVDDSGSHAAAVRSVLGSGQSDAGAQFGLLAADLNAGISADQAAFSSRARGGRDAFSGLAAGVIVASLIMAAGCAWGLSRRLVEYR